MINEQIAAIERPIDSDDPVSVVHGAERLAALLAEVKGSDADRVRVALCLWLRVLERHRDVANVAQALIDSPTATGIDRLWGRYWAANAAQQLIDDLEPPIAEYRQIVTDIGDDLSAEATDLGNRAWSLDAELWPAERFLSAFVPWAKPRFATADAPDQWVIVRRISEQAVALDDASARIDWLEEVLSWPALTTIGWRLMLRSRLAHTLFGIGAFDRAREQYLRLAEEASEQEDDADFAINAQLQAARAAGQGGNPRSAVRELERISVPRRGDDEEARKTRAHARGQLIEILLETDPTQGNREALDMWRDLKNDPILEVSYRAGLALASSWRELEPAAILQRSTWIIEHFAQPFTPDIQTLVVMALNSRTRARAETDDEAGAAADADAAVALLDDSVPDFVQETSLRNQQALQLRRGDYANRDEIYSVVLQLGDRADEASKAGDRESSARDYSRTFEMANLSPDPATRLVGLIALRNWTCDLVGDSQHARAAEIARASISNGIDDGQIGTELLAEAWLQLGLATSRLADNDTARYAYAQVATVVRDDYDPTLVDLATQAEWNLAVLLDDGRRPGEALQAYHRLITRVKPTAGITQQRRVAKALKNSAVIFRDELNRPADATRAWTEIVNRFDGHPDEEIARLVAEARPFAPKQRRGLFGRKG